MIDNFEKMIDRLTVILGMNELLLGQVFGPLLPEQARVLQEVTREAEELCSLVRGAHTSV